MVETRAQKAVRLAREARNAERKAEEAAVDAAVAPAAPAKKTKKKRAYKPKIRSTLAQKKEKHDAEYYLNKYTKKFGITKAKRGENVYTVKRGKKHYHFNPIAHKWMVKVPGHEVKAHTVTTRSYTVPKHYVKAHWQILKKTPKLLKTSEWKKQRRHRKKT